MSGLKRFLPELHWRLPRAKQYYSNWQGTHATKQANPFPPGVIMAYTGLAVATRQYSLAALLLVSDFSFPPWRRACFTHCSKGCNRPRPRANLGGAAQDKDIPVEILLWLSWFRLFCNGGVRLSGQVPRLLLGPPLSNLLLSLPWTTLPFLPIVFVGVNCS